MSTRINTLVGDHRLEQIRFASEVAAIGALRCSCDSPYFRGQQVTNNFVVAFPRSALWIHQDRAPAFVAASTVATIYNRGQHFERRPISPDGDTADWFAVSEDVVRDIVAEYDVEAAGLAAPLRFTHVDVTPAQYFAQRRVVEGLHGADRLAVEEHTIAIVRDVLHSAQHVSGRASRGALTQTRREADRRAIVECAKAVMSASCIADIGLREIARRCDVSVYHLCRTFRAVTGQTLFGFRRDLRLRAALAMLPDYRGRLSELAHTLGFASHSHFTAAFRGHFGVPPGHDDRATC